MKEFWGGMVDQVAFVNYLPWENAYDAKPNNYLHLFRLWRKEPHTFSHYERIFVWLSGVTLLLGTVLLYEQYLLFFYARLSLQEAGKTIADFCTPTIPQIMQEKIAIGCSFLEPNMKAVFDMSHTHTQRMEKSKNTEPTTL